VRVWCTLDWCVIHNDWREVEHWAGVGGVETGEKNELENHSLSNEFFEVFLVRRFDA
jgi:hypothetical protein